jgi:6-phosphogluconolactonase
MTKLQWSDLASQLIIGTYTRDTNSSGIYHLDQSGNLSCAAETDNPSYLAIHPSGQVLYCVNETSDYSDTVERSLTGAVSAFQLSDLGSSGFFLDLINQQPSMGADPCHLSIHSSGDYLVTSNYSGGTFASFALESNGFIEPFQSLTSHTGSGPNKDRQSSAHVHSSLLSESNQQVFIADLGADRVMQYDLDEQGAIGNQRQQIVGQSGSGPRYLAKNDTHLFVLNELDNTLVSYDLDTLSEQQNLSVVGPTETENLAAHLALSADSRYLYLTNRGLDSISVYEVEPHLKCIQTLATGGEHPRHFSLFNNDQSLVIANQHSNNLVVFARDSTTGKLSETELEFSVPAPSCVLPL